VWFFCGIRRATIERLDWKDVRFEEKRIIVPKHKGKNQTRYPVTLQENALEWLRPHLQESGSLLVPARTVNKAGASFGAPSARTTRRLVVEAAARAGIVLPDNAGRHTFISMHVAAFESIDKTSKEANNTPAIVKETYLDIVSPDDAKRYWAIRP
jgi:integrase